ncbi:hypothetical protein LCI18_005519 [Fusarium solani-melongenae]|uniref:Uncharacterized protein n=1 Tax=Fusarium solani subsp. cucurbitae TaxID=2747967 RepID=A0ACD3Z011_FUSSC|nr:hypothetical protein LCI18_005519 [Fusarium solani-melongenae]
MEAYWRTLCMDSVRSLRLNGSPSDKNRRYHRCSGDYVQEARKQWMSHTGLPLQNTKFTGEPALTMLGKKRSRSWNMEWLEIQAPKERDAEEKLTYIAVDFAVTSATMGSRLFLTRGGCISLGPEEVKAGDDAYVFAGAHMPFMVRHGEARDVPSIGRRECHQLVGECYIHGIMDGEAMGGFEQDKRPVFLI